jgi:hypothetical protein
MIRLSPGILNSTYRTLALIKEYKISRPDILLTRFQSIDGTKIDDIIDTAHQCQWINLSASTISLTAKGEFYSENFDIETKRAMMSDFINYTNPSWGFLIPRGRMECVPYMPVDVKACFLNAKLLEYPPSEDIVFWWDNQLLNIQKKKEVTNLSCGRVGEKLSLFYEKERTGWDAQWKSVESNLLGYDILSRVDRSSTTQMLIEVKSSENAIEYAIAYISRHEWDIAIQSKHYLFYFWLLERPCPRIAIIHPCDIEKHIPKDQGSGMWETTEIYFRLFKENFQKYPRGKILWS